MLTQESRLYQSIPVAEKYAIIESMRLELDRLYRAFSLKISEIVFLISLKSTVPVVFKEYSEMT